MAVAEDVERVYPTRSELETESQTNIPCPIVGCFKIFRQLSALRFHLVKLHRLILNESDARLAQHRKPQTKKLYEYYCPEANCKFSGHEQKCFQSYKKLKQHFMRLHAQRTRICFICGEKFGLNYDLTHHVSRCRKKPWCSSCRLCMGSWKGLAQHLRETGHEGLQACSSDAEIREQCLDETHRSTLVKECADGSSVVQAATTSQTTTLDNRSRRDVEAGMTENKEQVITIEASHQATEQTDIVPSTELNKIICSDMPSNLNQKPKPSETRNEGAADPAIHDSAISRDVGQFPRKKRSRLSQPKQKATPRTILPASNFLVVPAPVGTMLFYTVPIHQSKSKLKSLAPRQSQTPPDRDYPGTSRSVPITGDGVVTDRYTRDMSTSDLNSLESARVSASTQTRGRRIKVAETQTTEGGYVLKKTTFGAYNSPLARHSCGSQVSPRARVKRPPVQSIHTQTSRTLARKHKPSVSMQTVQSSVSSVAPSAPPGDDDVWPDFVHNETQTMELLQQLEASLAESSATQTLESYLFDNLPNCINASSNETCANPCGTIEIFATMTASEEGSELFDSVALPIVEDPPKQSIISRENISVSELECGLFSSDFPPHMVDHSEQNRNSANAQCCSSSSFLIHDDMFVSDLSSTGCCNDDLLSQQKMLTTETQTMHPSDCFDTDFLTAASQTNDFADMMSSTHTETQTVDDDFFVQFWSHMETQTTDEFLTEFGFSDTETQTTWVFGENVLPLDVASGIPPPPQESQGAVLLDMETQTCFQ